MHRSALSVYYFINITKLFHYNNIYVLHVLINIFKIYY